MAKYRTKSVPTDPCYTPFIDEFCRASKCHIREIMDGKQDLPFGRTKEDMRDTCVNACQRTAKDLAIWLTRNGHPLSGASKPRKRKAVPV